jgi:hypothetical protein
VFAKYALLALITLCAVLAVGGTLAAIDEAKKKRYEEAAKQAATAAVEAAGFLAVRRLIKRLTTENPSTDPDNR